MICLILYFDMQRVSEIAREYLKEISLQDNIEWDSLFYGDFMYLDEIFYKAFAPSQHMIPPLRHQKVLNALDRERKRKDAIFVKKYFRIEGRLVRYFELKND